MKLESKTIFKPINAKYFSTGTIIIFAIFLAGLILYIYRVLVGLGAVTNLDNPFPWGLWKAFNVVTGVALAAGGFTSVFLTHILHRDYLKKILRPALLTAALGYTFVVLGLVIDLGKWYNIWHPILPDMWQGNSVLFEIAMCVMLYLTVLYVELFPTVVKGLDKYNLPQIISKTINKLNNSIEKTIFLFSIAGIVLSCLHQSSLGTLMLIAPTKVHPLWFTPMLPVLFFFSAIAVGFPMIIFESTISSWVFKRPFEKDIFFRLSRIIVFTLGAYILLKMGDFIYREAYFYLFPFIGISTSEEMLLRKTTNFQAIMFILELFIGLFIPWIMLLFKKIRNNVTMLFITCSLIISGVVLNRINVSLVSYDPPFLTKTYFPALSEFIITFGTIAAFILIYRFFVIRFPFMQEK